MAGAWTGAGRGVRGGHTGGRTGSEKPWERAKLQGLHSQTLGTGHILVQRICVVNEKANTQQASAGGRAGPPSGLSVPPAWFRPLCIHLAFSFWWLVTGCLRKLADPGGLASSSAPERKVPLS